MWNSWVEQGKAFAEKAKVAAEQIEGQLNESVGTSGGGGASASGGDVVPGSAAASASTSLDIVDDLNDDDAFYNDDADSGYVGGQQREEEETVDLAGKLRDTTGATGATMASLPLPVSPEPAAVAAPPLVTEEGDGAGFDKEGNGDGWAGDDDGLDGLEDVDVEDVDLNGGGMMHGNNTTVDTAGGALESKSAAPSQPLPQKREAGTVGNVPDEPLAKGDEKHGGWAEEDIQLDDTEMYDDEGDREVVEDVPLDQGKAQLEDMSRSFPSVEKPTEVRHPSPQPTEVRHPSPQPREVQHPSPQPTEPADVKEEPVPATTPHPSELISPPPDAETAPLPTTSTPGVSEEQMLQLREEHSLAVALLQSQMDDLKTQLSRREDQLLSKTEQLGAVQEMHESEKEELRAKIRETKDEAKRRILRAKERVEEMQVRLNDAQRQVESAGSEAGGKDEVIAALRQEGESLARKQGQMEQAVRAAKAEARDCKERLEGETASKDVALSKIKELESTLKSTKDELASARKGETKADRLESDLVAAREESEKNAGTVLSLEQQVKELKAANKDLKQEVQEAKSSGLIEAEQRSNEVRKEHGDMLADLEVKLRTSEREANVREDALRHEVGELRKRWQDAVRRADALSMDVQQSTAPLMRQLESTERQNRARAAGWAELETKLRSDLEEAVISNERLSKERNELRALNSKLERLSKEREVELTNSRSTIDELTDTVEALEARTNELEKENAKVREEYTVIERTASEGVSKVRSDMMQTVLDSEERYRAKIAGLEAELHDERTKRTGLEGRLEELASSAGMAELSSYDGYPDRSPKPKETKQKKLRGTTGQAEILQNTLLGLGDTDEENEDGEDDGSASNSLDSINVDGGNSGGAASSSFAAMEQLSQGLRGAKLELAALRKQLASSEETRESLLSELGEMRAAAEKLPLFEAKVNELTLELREKELEIMGLRDDIAEVRLMYRGQLDALLEEKAANTPVKTERKAFEEEGESRDAISDPSNGVVAADDVAPPIEVANES